MELGATIEGTILEQLYWKQLVARTKRELSSSDLIEESLLCHFVYVSMHTVEAFQEMKNTKFQLTSFLLV